MVRISNIGRADSRNGADVGDEVDLRLALPDGRSKIRRFTVVGFLNPGGLSFVKGVASAVISLEDAEAILGPEREYVVKITTRSGLNIQDSLTAIMSDLGTSVKGAQNTALLTAMSEGSSDQLNGSLHSASLISVRKASHRANIRRSGDYLMSTVSWPQRKSAGMRFCRKFHRMER